MTRAFGSDGSARVFGTPGASAWSHARTEFIRSSSASSSRRRPDPGRGTAGVLLVLGGALLVAAATSVLADLFWGALVLGAALVGIALVRALSGRSSPRAMFAAAQQEFRRTRDPALMPPSARSWAYGALGEELVGEVLSGLGHEYQVAHDLRIVDDHGRERANIDHVVTGPGGTVMVDSKYWAGIVVRNDRGDGLRRTGAGAEGLDATERAVDSLAYEARAIPGGAMAIVVAVVGKGSVSGGQVVLEATKERPMLVAVHARDLLGTVVRLNAVSPRRRGRSIRRLLRQSGGRLRLN